MKHGWGPDSKRSSVCITFDNFGEAAEIELGLWPPESPIGSHSSLRGLQDVRRILERNQLRGTFYLEGWNARHYPDTVRTLAEEGHEVAFHGYRHESWSAVSPERAKLLAEQGIPELKSLAGSCVGFRPPGGQVPDSVLAVLAQNGICHISPLGEHVEVRGGMASLPFQWRSVDALYFEPLLSKLRQEYFGSDSLGDANQWRAELASALDRALAAGEVLNVIFHPYLIADEPERLSVFADFIKHCALHSDLWLARSRDVAEWVLAAEQT